MDGGGFGKIVVPSNEIRQVQWLKKVSAKNDPSPSNILSASSLYIHPSRCTFCNVGG